MFDGGGALEKIVQYMKAHWPSVVKTEWQVGLNEYAEISKKVLQDFIQNKTCQRKMVRLAGISGSGKTTQLLPAAEAYCEKQSIRPVLVAARRFVEYHPYYEEIMKEYGVENVRKMTDEFATIMMFIVMSELVEKGFDIILDVTLLDVQMEAILVDMTNKNQYENILLMMVAAPEVTEKFLAGRNWRHTKETEQEFIRATEKALRFYAEKQPAMRSVLWNVYEKEPVYDGKVSGALKAFEQYSKITEIPEHDEKDLLEAKIAYLAK